MNAPVPDREVQRAVIVGAGIAGLAAAIGLRRAGWVPVVLERSAQPSAIGAGLSLWSNGLAALDRLGVGAAVRRAGAPQEHGGVRRPDGRWLSRGSATFGGQSGVELLMLHRAHLHRALLAALPADTVVGSAVVREVEQTDDAVEVRYEGPDGERRLRADLLVGADGVHSLVRARCWPDAPPPSYTGVVAWRGITDHPVDLGGGAAGTWGPGAEFGVAPLAEGRVYWYGTAILPAGATVADDHAAVLARFGRWHHPIPAVVEATAPTAVLRHALDELPRPLPRFDRGRVVLIGDAAHAMTPHLGQGAGVALEDAVTLATTMGANPDVACAARAYDAARRPRAQRIAGRSAQMGRLIGLEHPAGVALRNLLLRVTPSRVALSSVARTVAWEPP